MRRETPAYGKMSSSGRRRSSKWDLKEESHIPFENIHDKPWPGKAGLSFHDNEKCESLSPEAAGGNHSKWPVPEPLPGRRGSRRNDSIDAVRKRNLKAMTTWDGEESYGTRMSPGLDEWRQQNHHNSPKNEWKGSKRSRSQSRSRSRSPIHGFGREPGLYDRCRSRSGASAQLCKDYVSGRCRRGNHCQFLHAHTYEDEWERHRKTMTSKYSMPCDSEEYPSGSGRSTDCCNEFLEGNCRRGSSCRFAHHGASHVAGKVSSNDAIRDRNNGRRQRDASLERHSDRESRRTVDIPCKFFAAGNCRNGKYCRFSHQGRGYPSPDRSGDDRISLDHDSVHVDKLWNKWSTTTSDAGKLSEDKDQIIGATDQRGTAWSVDNRWGCCLEEDKKLSDTPIDHTMVEIEKKEALLWKTENAGDSISASEQRVGENWLGDTDMSPEWNYKIRPSNNVDKEGHASLTNCDPSTTQQASVQMHDSTVVMPSEINESYAKPLEFNLPDVGVSALPHDNKSMAEKIASSQGSILSNMISAHSINQNGLNSNALPHTCLNSGGNENPQIQTLVQGEKTINNPDVVEPIASQVKSGVAIKENNVSSEKLTTISVSLAQLFANGQQLPQFYFAHSSHAHNIPEMSSVANSEGPIKTVSAVNMQSNESIGIEAEKNEVNNNPPGFFPACIRQTNNTNGKPEMTSKNKLPSSVGVASKSGDNDKFCSLEEANDKKCQLNQLEPGANSIVTNKNNGVLNEENRKLEEDKPAQENGPLEYIDGDDKMDEGKKGKDVKGIRAFKFALVEFVKELLKPTWKEGQMSKDAYKNIVKKVVDKVMGTMQGANIPQTQEKVQQYLSLSKPKLTKLVQAYVEKFQKDK